MNGWVGESGLVVQLRPVVLFRVFNEIITMKHRSSWTWGHGMKTNGYRSGRLNDLIFYDDVLRCQSKP